MITVTHEKKVGYHIDGKFSHRHKARVVSDYRHIDAVVIGNACDRAKVLGETVILYQMPDGRWTHDKICDDDPVLCVDTGQVYDNLIAASLHMGAAEKEIRNVLNGVKQTAGGYRWVSLKP